MDGPEVAWGISGDQGRPSFKWYKKIEKTSKRKGK
jgi:hypothetical protein